MDHHVISYLHVVPKGKSYKGKRLEVLPAATEHEGGQKAAEGDPKRKVLTEGAPVKHLPEPQQWLYACVRLHIDFVVVFRLQCDVSGVELGRPEPAERWAVFGQGSFLLVREVEIPQKVGAHLVPVCLRGTKGSVEPVEPVAVDGFRLGRDLDATKWKMLHTLNLNRFCLWGRANR